jgi:hypothetical protein
LSRNPVVPGEESSLDEWREMDEIRWVTPET